MNALNIDGLVAATATPMHGDGSINLDMIKPQVDFLVNKGVKGIYVLGSTGEGFSLTDDERKAVTVAFVKATAGRMKTFIQVGHNSWQASAELAAHAESAGADAVSATPPGYFKPEGEQGLVDGLKIITDAAPRTPFYYYHIPFLSGVNINVGKFTSMASEQLDSFVGIKYSDGSTLYNLQTMQEAGPGKEFLSGSDEAYLMSVAQGYKGAVGSTYGYGASIYQNVRAAVECGDFTTARMWQQRALVMIDTLFATCGRAGLKAIWGLVGVDCGPVRSPLPAASAEQIEELRKRLEHMGFFEWDTEKLRATA
ncbi:MAG: dihydrodipicolinate synthase family protein [Akkermansiaceae bacterium]|nr:dihydrodipicolinate synthase family protein [Akkermansiaceae bacterium]